MPPIPTVEGSLLELPSAATAGAIDMGAAMAPGRGAVAIAQGFGDVAAATGGIAAQMLHAKNVAAEADFAMRMDKTFADYQQEMATNTDEETWVLGWQNKVNDMRQQFASADISPAARRAIGLQLNEWAAKTEIQIGAQATKRTVQRQRARVTTAAEYMWKNGDYEKGVAFIDAGERAGFIMPEDAADLRIRGREMVDFNAANRLINDDPIAAIAALEDKTPTGRWRQFTGVDENKRHALVVEARRALARLREDTYRGIIEKRNAREIVDTKELQSLVDQQLLTSTQMRAILTEQRRSGDDPAVYAEAAAAFRAADKYDPQQDPTNERFVEIFMMGGGLPAPLREELEKRLRRKTTPSEANRTRLVDDYVEGMFDGGFYGNAKAIEGRALFPQEYVAAHEKVVRLKAEARRYAEANANATPEDILKHVQKLDGDALTDPTAVVDAINGQIPGDE